MSDESEEFLTRISAAIETCLANAFKTSVVFGRPLQTIDPKDSIGVEVDEWNPDGYGVGQMAAVSGSYVLNVYVMVKHLDLVAGRAMHGNRTRRVRHILSSDIQLRQPLGAIRDTTDGYCERFQGLFVLKQIYRTGFLTDNEHLFLLLTQVTIYTETVGGY